MEPSFTIRPALPVDVEPIFSILSEVACHVPIDLSTPKHVGALKAQVDECCRGGLSFVAVDEDNVVDAELTNPISKNSEIAANLICRARPTEGNSGVSVHEAVRRVGCVPGLQTPA